jgi:uncharacterized membrane protein
MERNKEGTTHFTVHVSPILYVLAPLYAIHKSAETLIAMQSLFVITSSISLYFLSKRLLNEKTACLLSISWAIYLPILGGYYYDFHEASVGPTLLFLLGLSILKKQKLLPWVICLLLAGVKEDYPLLCIPAVLLYGYWSNRMRMAYGLTIMLLAYVAIIQIAWIIPHTENFTAKLYGSMGVKTPIEFILLVLKHPEKIIENILTPNKILSILQLLIPLGFLCLKNPWTYILLAGPILILYSSESPNYGSNFFHYSFIPSALLFLATIDTLKRYSSKKQENIAIMLVILGTIGQLSFGALSNKEFRVGFLTITNPVKLENREAYKELQEILKEIPKHAIIASDDTISSHTSNRKTAYSLKLWHENTIQEMPEHMKPEYVLRWTSKHQFGAVPINPNLEGYKEVQRGKYFIVIKKMD